MCIRITARSQIMTGSDSKLVNENWWRYLVKNSQKHEYNRLYAAFSR